MKQKFFKWNEKFNKYLTFKKLKIKFEKILKYKLRE